MNYKIINNDCLLALDELEEASIDSIVTDPPYGLTSITKRFGKEDSAPAKYGRDGSFARLSRGFMGKEWDGSGIEYNIEMWQKCLRVLKPGGYLLAFGGSRTFHRIAVAIEDAGFEIRDTIMWLYGSGFPKSMDISKQIDKRNGRNYNEDFRNYINSKRLEKNISLKQINEKLGVSTTGGGMASNIFGGKQETKNVLPTKKQYKILKDLLELDDRFDNLIFLEEAEREVIGKSNYSIPSKIYDIANGSGERLEQNITVPSTDLAKQWQGWGTALKPSFEPIIVARKPFKGSLVDNVIQYGVGGINIDECRVEISDKDKGGFRKGVYTFNCEATSYKPRKNGDKYKKEQHPLGRFPANTILTYDETDFDEVCGGFPKDKGYKPHKVYSNIKKYEGYGSITQKNGEIIGYGDSGSASRYFYCAKASKKDRDEGLEEFETKSHEEINNRKEGSAGATRQYGGGTNPFLSVSCPRKNIHPTVKPTELMQYLVRLVTPKGGTILDPFMGSGSTGKAVMFENKERNAEYKFIGIEKEKEYSEIAEARIKFASEYKEEKEDVNQISFIDFIKGE